jgi:hypothetical protein
MLLAVNCSVPESVVETGGSSVWLLRRRTRTYEYTPLHTRDLIRIRQALVCPTSVDAEHVCVCVCGLVMRCILAGTRKRCSDEECTGRYAYAV